MISFIYESFQVTQGHKNPAVQAVLEGFLMRVLVLEPALLNEQDCLI